MDSHKQIKLYFPDGSTATGQLYDIIEGIIYTDPIHVDAENKVELAMEEGDKVILRYRLWGQDMVCQTTFLGLKVPHYEARWAFAQRGVTKDNSPHRVGFRLMLNLELNLVIYDLFEPPPFFAFMGNVVVDDLSETGVGITINKPVVVDAFAECRFHLDKHDFALIARVARCNKGDGRQHKVGLNFLNQTLEEEKIIRRYLFAEEARRARFEKELREDREEMIRTAEDRKEDIYLP